MRNRNLQNAFNDAIVDSPTRSGMAAIEITGLTLSGGGSGSSSGGSCCSIPGAMYPVVVLTNEDFNHLLDQDGNVLTLG